MCTPASLVLTKDKVFFSKVSNSHEDIIEEYCLAADGVRGPNVLRVEVVPPKDDYSLPIEEWDYRVDQIVLPEWVDAMRDEQRTRTALKEWNKYHCCTQENLRVNAQMVGGFMVVQSAGNEATQTASFKSTQTASLHATQKASNHTTQTAGGLSTQTASHYSTQTAGGLSTQTAGSWSTQTASCESIQTAGHNSTQIAGYISTQKAGDHSTQIASFNSTQKAGNHSTQKADFQSIQTASNHATQMAGFNSTQTAGNNSYQKAGVGTVQIGRWFENGNFTVSTRVINEETADKWYKFANGDWSLVDDNEIPFTIKDKKESQN